jgi:shikimate dehydrogenase
MRLLYLLGYPVAHSLSPAMQNAALRAAGLNNRYRLLPVPPAELAGKVVELRNPKVVGFNVTIPHKIAIIPMLDKVDWDAAAIGAVNTVVNENGRLVGHNTDCVAAVRVLEEASGGLAGRRVVCIGAGGAARAVVYGLAPHVAEITILARDETKAESLAGQMRAHSGADFRAGGLDEAAKALRSADILVNATPVGMHPNVDSTPVEPSTFHGGLLVFDLVYNPERTRLLRDAESAGARTVGGLGMLVYQGAEAYRLWTGRKAPMELMMETARSALGGIHA